MEDLPRVREALQTEAAAAGGRRAVLLLQEEGGDEQRLHAVLGQPPGRGAGYRVAAGHGLAGLNEGAQFWIAGGGRADPAGPFRGGLAPGALRRVLAYVEENFCASIELSQLARVAGVSLSHFSRAFKQSKGATPHQYVMSRRIAAACKLVAGTDTSLCEIALATGFADQSHFTRCFSQALGRTPREYRRLHR